jgi:hypothetical protein
MTAFDIDGLVKNISQLPKTKARRGVMMDEPDDKYHISSEKGKIFRRIIGKLRQQHLAIGLCATDLNDIPPYMFRKIDRIFFTPYLGKFMLFKNRPKKQSYLIQEIRKDYTNKGYKIFFQLKGKEGCLGGTTIKASPFDFTDNDEYLKNKLSDYERDIQSFLDKSTDSEKRKESDDKRTEIIKIMHKNGLSHTKIAENVGLSRQRIQQLLSKSLNASC